MTETYTQFFFDVDGTLMPTDSHPLEERIKAAADLDELQHAIVEKQFAGGKIDASIATGRSAESLHEYADKPLVAGESGPPPLVGFSRVIDTEITSVGTTIHFRGSDDELRQDYSWPPPYRRSGWDDDIHEKVFTDLEELGLKRQRPEAQFPYKISLAVDLGYPPAHNALVPRIKERLGALGLPRAEVVYSSGEYVDIVAVHKGHAVAYASHVLRQQRIDSGDVQPDKEPCLVVAGDSMNDIGMMAIADCILLPSNAHDELQEWTMAKLDPTKVHLATKPYAAGILQGARYFNLV
jgi:hydroxymethylpyrimidine pyrophosphatase-like HAD family hydrolase